MHEMALATSVLQIVERTARQHGARRVSAVRLEIGRLSHVEPEALRFPSMSSRATVSPMARGSRFWRLTGRRGACAAATRWRSSGSATGARAAEATSSR